MKNLITFFLFLLPIFTSAQITPVPATVTDTSVIFWDVPTEIPLSVFQVEPSCFAEVTGTVDSLAASHLVFYHIGAPCCMYDDINLDCCKYGELEFPTVNNNDDISSYMEAFLPLIGCGNTPVQYRIINLY